jgi:asparagine synthase (glutamine-hydrolysing)
MCGIFTFIKKDNLTKDDISDLLKEFYKIQHRGPDNSSWITRPNLMNCDSESGTSSLINDLDEMDISDNTNILYNSDKIYNKSVNKNKYHNHTKTPINIFMGFHRLSINDLSENGNQPFISDNVILICNGEIYNYKQLASDYNIKLKSNSDCEVILQLYKLIGFEEMIKKLDGVFACILYDSLSNILHVARDPIGVRSMYVGFNKNGDYGFCSELKGLSDIMDVVEQFKPGCTWNSCTNQYFCYYDHTNIFHINSHVIEQKQLISYVNMSENNIKKNIKEKFTNAVKKRLISDRPIGCLLSGGLDSSLVAAILATELEKSNKILKTFSVGLYGSTDLKYANMVAKFIGSEHHELVLSESEMLAGIEPTIYQLETWDTTTIRAGTPMFLLAKYIKKNFDTTVIYSGEGSDEISGSYLYFHNAPDPMSFKQETMRLVKDLSYYDVLRCDKSIAGAGLEVRVPFLDKEFIQFYMNIDPSLKMPSYGNIEKYLLRSSFDNDFLPESVLWRIKEGMSDGVSPRENSWYSIIQFHANMLYTDEYFNSTKKTYPINPPEFKEALYYREIFNKYFPGRNETIPYYWLPKWSGDVVEPSARTLPVYYRNLIK